MYVRRPAQSGQVIALPTSAPYWLTRAEEALKGGDTRRALALTRRAAELEPDNAEVLEGYARLLRQTDNYERSARVAFRALACQPERYALYALLGHDLQDVNRVQEAMDAYGHFLSAGRAAGDSGEWNEEYADVEDIVQGSMPEGGDARYLAALDIASRRLAEGELSRARQA
ncbi:MAG: tetratricopeptide repeat protein, partial [Eubacteriales bacterium]|nr:tetratricopeptide repeat protein [Eubacteriales bacterium]